MGSKIYNYAMPKRDYNLINILGKTFGDLTVTKRSGAYAGNATWECQCVCGASIVVRGDALRRGEYKHCRRAPHQQISNDKTPRELFPDVYTSWLRMRERCLNRRHRNFKNYGGRGITICQEWNSFDQFLSDMGPRPKGHGLERKDNDGNYCKDNCAWILHGDQHRNRRCSIYIDYQGKRTYLADLARQHGLPTNIVYQRLKLGWTVEHALTVRVAKRV